MYYIIREKIMYIVVDYFWRDVRAMLDHRNEKITSSLISWLTVERYNSKCAHTVTEV